MAKFTSATAVGNSSIVDNGTTVALTTKLTITNGTNGKITLTRDPPFPYNAIQFVDANGTVDLNGGGDGILMSPSAAGKKALIVQAAASQTANLTEWQNSSGTAVAAIASGGNIYIKASNVLASGYGYLDPGATAAGVITLYGGSGEMDFNVTGSFNMIFRTVGTERMRIDSSGNVSLFAQADLRLYDVDSSNYVAIQSAGAVATNWTLTLPDNDGNAGQFLQTDGTGTTTWATGASGAQGAQGSQGAQGFQGAKPAIVPIQTFLGEEYVELLCVEMPEVYFEDFMTVKAGNQGHQSHIVTKEMDSTFMQVCEPGTIKVTAAMPSVAAQVGAKVQGPTVEVEVEGRNIQNREVDITVRLSGIRAGMVGRRFAKRTYDQMVKNNRFWEQWSQ